ncbi:MAG: alpha/beta hydrolase [Gemmataceae bacterium]|nr:alpha/beta hydrolase [Gemmataceae bacterium]MCI0740812.1 alpha/beta hydrolase [Gemmataceae bacterium]
MPRYWMVTNRNVKSNGLGSRRDKATYWTADSGPLDDFNNWTKVTESAFQKLLVAAAGDFPLFPDPKDQEKQKHVSILVHGYNNSWDFACGRYQKLSEDLYEGADGLGLLILFSWPSDGMPTNYLPDRSDAEASGDQFAELLSQLYEWLLKKQQDAADDESKACRAKLSLIAHSMGNYVVQKAMWRVWTRVNQPLLVSLINQFLMVAADVDNDLFGTGESVEYTDGDAIANLTYRVTALYSRRDSVLGMSAGLKHFGKRRLGRSGLDTNFAVPDNVWDFECSPLFDAGTSSSEAHSAYFHSAKTLQLMTGVLKGIDREIVIGGL